jgi:GH43 family beta-xylosidase
VPAYDRIELRRARTIAELAGAPTVDVWRKPDTGPCSELIWAPELHRLFDTWVIFFAAAPSRAIKDDLFQHRMWAITTTALPIRSRAAGRRRSGSTAGSTRSVSTPPRSRIAA